MFKKIFGKENPIAGEGHKYPAVVEEIHNKFMSASDELVAQAKEVLKTEEVKDVDKADRLKDLGFTALKEVKKVETIKKSIELSKDQIQLVHKYSFKYPNYKFITETQVEAICKKYNLICGDVDRFEGFVPRKNLVELERFMNTHGEDFKSIWKIGDEFVDMSEYELRSSRATSEYVHFYDKEGKPHFQGKLGEYEKEGLYADGYINGKFYNATTGSRLMKAKLQICAPIKDMNTEGLRIRDGYKLEHIPDPVVLQPVIGGYLILTAWGDEAEDPIVVNNKMN